MRWVDQSLGTVACHGLAAAKALSAPFVRAPERVRKIAVMKFFGLGSIVIASPSVAALREAFPSARIYFVTFKSNREVLEILGAADETILIDNSSMASFVRSTAEAIRKLRAEDVDLAIDFEFFAKFPLVLASVSGITKKAGFYLTLESWRKALLDVHGYYNHYYHTKDIFLSLVYLITTGDRYYLEFDAWRARHPYPVHTPGEADLAFAKKVLAEAGYRDGQRLVLLNPNVSPDLAPVTKRWPEGRYTELAKAIVQEFPDAFVAMLGAPSEKDYVQRLSSAARSPQVVSLAGAVNLRQLLALLSMGDLFVTNDSGPMHLACLVDVPILGLFFAETPLLFGPIAKETATVTPSFYSVPMFTVYTGKNSQDMDNLPARAVPVEDVMARIRGLFLEGTFRTTAPSREGNGVGSAPRDLVATDSATKYRARAHDRAAATTDGDAPKSTRTPAAQRRTTATSR